MRTILLIVFSLISTGAFAQSPSDPAFLNNALQVLQQQRNRALDEAAVSQAQYVQATKEIEVLKKQIADLHKPADAPKK